VSTSAPLLHAVTVRLCDECALELGKAVDVELKRGERFRAACAYCRRIEKLLQFEVPVALSMDRSTE
jgi:hypothetical protein